MAQVVRKDCALTEEYKRSGRLQDLGYILLVIGVPTTFAVLVFGFSWLLMLLTVPCIVVGIVFVSVFDKNTSIVASGVEGEDKLRKTIERLPETFIGYQNVHVFYNGEQSELDMVVIGLTGIFVIEVKNHNGTIVGNLDDRNWVQHKVGRNGTPYSKEMYSPIKQVGTHVYRLANYLRDRGVKCRVESIVYFANPEADLQLYGKSDKTAVFCERYNGGEALLDYILNRPETISKEDAVKAVILLDGGNDADIDWAVKEVNRPVTPEEREEYNRYNHNHYNGSHCGYSANVAYGTTGAYGSYNQTPFDGMNHVADAYVLPKKPLPVPPSFCFNCGSPVGLHDCFCQKCGTRIATK